MLKTHLIVNTSEYEFEESLNSYLERLQKSNCIIDEIQYQTNTNGNQTENYANYSALVLYHTNDQ